MSDTPNPENIFSGRPSNLDPEAVRAQIATSNNVIAFSCGALALEMTTAVLNVIPNLVEAAEASDLNNLAQYGVVSVFLGGLSVMSVSTLKAHWRHRSQAKTNRRFNTIVDNDRTDPDSL